MQSSLLHHDQLMYLYWQTGSASIPRANRTLLPQQHHHQESSRSTDTKLAFTAAPRRMQAVVHPAVVEAANAPFPPVPHCRQHKPLIRSSKASPAPCPIWSILQSCSSMWCCLTARPPVQCHATLCPYIRLLLTLPTTNLFWTGQQSLLVKNKLHLPEESVLSSRLQAPK